MDNLYYVKNLALLSTCLLLSFNTLQVSAISLEDVYYVAETSDPEFKQVAANKRAVLESRPQALAGLLPSASISANTVSNDQDLTSQGFGASGKTSFTYE